MPENNKTEEFLKKLAPCIEHGELEKCVEEAARVAGEMGIGAEELLDLSLYIGSMGIYVYSYVIALAAAHGLEDTAKAGAYCNAGIAAQVLGNVKKAEKYYKQAIVYNPNYAEVHHNYALLLKKLDRKTEAEEQYKLAIATNPNLEEVHYNYSILLSELNRKTEAEEHCKLAIAANPNDVDVHANYANLLKELNRKTEAEKQYKLAIAANPNYAKAHYNYAILLYELNRKSEAEEQYKLAIAANPNYAGAHSNYASLLKELNRKTEAEKHYKLAIAANPNLAAAHSNYGLLLFELNRKSEAEKQYKPAIATNPNLAAAHYNYALLLFELNRKTEAEEHCKLAITANPNDAEAHYYYANLLVELKRKPEAEEQYKLAIAANPNYAEAYNNYALLLEELKHKLEAEEQYKQAIAANSNLAAVHSNYAFLLFELNRKTEAEEHSKLAIAANPNSGEDHATYGLLLINNDRREEAFEHTEKASDLFFRAGRVTDSHFVKALFYQVYSKKNLNRKRFNKSSEDAIEAGEEYLKAASTADGYIKDYLTMQGNIFKAKSYVRKIPEKSWYKKIYYRFVKNPDIDDLIKNLRSAAIYYEEASICPAGEKKDVCNACSFSMNVFSETLNAMSAFMKGTDAEIRKDEWTYSLDQAYKIYSEKNLNKGVELVITLRQLIKCVNELAEHRKIRLHNKEEKLGKCYKNLIEVSYNLEGALKVLAEYSTEAIRDYAKKKGMRFINRDNPEISFWDKPLNQALLAVATIVAVIIAILQFTKLDTQAFEYLKSIFFNRGSP